MKRLLLSLCIGIVSVLLFSGTAFAECESGSITFHPETGTTNTTFGYAGTIANCPNQVSGTLRLIGAIQGAASGRGGEPFNYALQTDASGNFSGNGKFITPGTYTLRIVFGGANVTLASQPTITVTAGRTYQCGEESSESTQCPAGCATTYHPPTQKWYCGQPLPTSAACAQYTLAQIGPCNLDALSEVIRCGTNASGYTCSNSDMQVCMKGTPSEANVKCQDPNAKAPTPQPTPPCAQGAWENGKCTAFNTAIGSVYTEPMEFIKWIFGLLLGLSGGIAVILIMIGGYQLMTSQGNKEAVQSARERITSAIVGLLFLIFSLVILQIIGVDILSIPGFR